MKLEGDNSLNGYEALSPFDTDALWIASKSLTYKDEKHEIRIPRKKEKQLGSKYSVALNRLANTEKRLLKDRELGKKYNEIITHIWKIDTLRELIQKA